MERRTFSCRLPTEPSCSAPPAPSTRCDDAVPGLFSERSLLVLCEVADGAVLKGVSALGRLGTGWNLGQRYLIFS